VCVGRRSPNKSTSQDSPVENHVHSAFERPQRYLYQLAPFWRQIQRQLLLPTCTQAARLDSAQRAKYTFSKTESAFWQCHTSSISRDWMFFRRLPIPSCPSTSLQPWCQSVRRLSIRRSESETQRRRIRDVEAVARESRGATWSDHSGAHGTGRPALDRETGSRNKDQWWLYPKAIPGIAISVSKDNDIIVGINSSWTPSKFEGSSILF
jgi:hypothetical protein